MGLVINLSMQYFFLIILIGRDPIDTDDHVYHFSWTFEAMAHIILPTIHGSVETGISPISKDGMDISHESFVRDFVPGYLS